MRVSDDNDCEKLSSSLCVEEEEAEAEIKFNGSKVNGMIISIKKKRKE
jgi:hypothetical protein